MGKKALGFAVLFVAVIALGFIGYNMGWFEKDTTSTQIINRVISPPQSSPSGSSDVSTGQPIIIQQNTAPVSNVADKIPVESLKATAKNKYTMAAGDAGIVKFYQPGADVSDPYILALDSIDVNNGNGSTASYVIQTNTAYDVYYDGNSSTYYDMKLAPEINYNPETGKGFLLVNGLSYIPLVPVGAFVDVADLPELQSCMNDTTSDDTAYYDESSCGGSAWFRVDIGNANSNSELQDVVMCFRDSASGLEGNELTSLTATYVSGSTKVSIPGDLQAYWNDAAGGGSAQCITIAKNLGSGEKSRWELTMTVDETNLESAEAFQITFDDLGDYLQKQYPSRNAKATAESLTITQQD